MISKKHHSNDSSTEDYDHLLVNTVTMDDDMVFTLEKGFSFKDIHDLIKHHRKSQKLYFPVRSPEAVPNERNSITDSIRTIPEEPAVAQDIPEIIVDESTYPIYLHGDIIKEEAEECLANKPGGTFLVRHNNDSYKISFVITTGSKVKHTVIHETDGMFSLTNQKKFGSLNDLVENYRSVAQKNK